MDLLEPLAFLLSRLMNGLATRLATRALATDELRLRLQLENRATHERTLRLPVPSLDTKAFLKLLQLDLSGTRRRARGACLDGVNPVKPQAAQSRPVRPGRARAGETGTDPGAHQIHRRAAASARPELLDTHRPDAFRMTHRHSLPSDAGSPPAEIPARPPPLSSPARRARSARLRPSEFRHRRRHPRQNSRSRRPLAHFRRLVDRRPLVRDEWDIALSDGALYRLYCDPTRLVRGGKL